MTLDIGQEVRVTFQGGVVAGHVVQVGDDRVKVRIRHSWIQTTKWFPSEEVKVA
jgi:hypothetical protein